MNKAWVTFLLFGWTVVMVVLAPVLLSFSTYSSSRLKTPGMLGLPGVEIRLTTKRPLLDWTGRLASTSTEILWDDEVVYSSVPGRSGFSWRADMLAKYDLAIGSDGKPSFSERKQSAK